ncbi:heavy metal-associated isoprenylated plant protein 35-like [Iris pallida]|uniref:Heavy metal-associated isoprenylated plant protein 35-like n=1 Tax=Iris pallida TaxID=29817 RepID=A0AAX6E1Y6_IRIPA|nr:heavy metal-associated isoprenylated plant protein 35-like [Iris pallida]
MASKEEATELHTCVLKVSIHCEGCKKKVKKILRKIHGVQSVDIDAQQKKVTVTGDVDAETLIRCLAKSGKHADAWPEKAPANPISGSSTKEKNKEKESETPPEKMKKSQPAAEEVAKAPPAATSSEPDAKPAEKQKSSAEPAAEPTSEKKEAPKNDKKPEKERADAESGTDTKPSEASVKSVSSGKKGKKQGEPSSSSSSAAAPEGHYGSYPRHQPSPSPAPYQVPVYQHPVYAVSHNTAHPMASQSHYYAPMPPPMPQSYSHSGHNNYNYNYSHPPPSQPQPEYYPSRNYSYHSSENNYYGPSMEPRSSSPPRSYYYGSSMEPRSSSPPRSYYYGSGEPRASPSHSSQGSLDMFSEENANACNVM